MPDHICTVSDAFESSDKHRSTLVLPMIAPTIAATFTHLDELELHRPDGTTALVDRFSLLIDDYGSGFPKSDKWGWRILVFPDLLKVEVPVGTEIWRYVGEESE